MSRQPQWALRPPEQLAPDQRAAFQRRREQLLAAARTVIARLGPAFTMTDVAREARLGMSSVYRTFASKDDLLADLLDERLPVWLEIWARHEGRADAGQALIDAMWEFAELEHRDLGMAAALRGLAFRQRELVEQSARAGERLLAQAQAAGELRADLDYGDVLRIFLMLSEIADEHEWRRGLEIYIAGMRPPA
ncbi:TetR family transcriptional regulator [Conexibacter sp. JD483]|uniref:TetR/AcrR family transcriptional regulator n=1 Tax=unclassified Conexibacter TaxID=2627773 RepID=UPI002723FD7D|nr:MULTISPECIES: TetR family transcriptional regulator [unclassified Conexibacter]MDO8188626.1 TetR family transcriptional regulator [Conexibacter sp. CPCC 205706]MDO8201538.1 TetR family transcriptional regulator [Conexibacter sp. CPCC 205762]MDR9370757.1 TetR family transcriptional regulator [Conexibacter sp. JD483]